MSLKVHFDCLGIPLRSYPITEEQKQTATMKSSSRSTKDKVQNIPFPRLLVWLKYTTVKTDNNTTSRS
jgi:hypothetical protein